MWMPYSYYFIHKKLPVGLENMCGCHTLITLSTPPVAIILALEQYSKQFTPLGMETSLTSLQKQCKKTCNHFNIKKCAKGGNYLNGAKYAYHSNMPKRCVKHSTNLISVCCMCRREKASPAKYSYASVKTYCSLEFVV